MNMNIFKQKVDDMDRHHRILMRVASFAGAATLLAVALWSAGVLPEQIPQQVQSWFASQFKDAPIKSVSLPPSIQATKPASQITVIPPGTDSSVSPVTLPLYLVATSPGRNLKEGSARIGANPEFPQTFVAGAVLANGAKLAEIHRDHVVLERGKQRIDLYVGADKNKELTQRTKGSLALAQVGGTSPTTALRPTSETKEFTDVIRSMAV